MAFPTTHQGLQREMFLDGAWRHVPLRQANDVLINVGRRDRAATAQTSDLAATIDNVSGDWDRKNPQSIYYGMLGLGVPLRVRSPTEVTDAFGRSVTDGLGSTTSGHPWTLSGTAAQFDVDGSKAVFTPTGVGVTNRGYLAGLPDLRVYGVLVDMTITPSTPASGYVAGGILLRGTAATAYTALEVRSTSAGVIQLAISDGTTVFAGPTTITGVTVGATYRVLAIVEGSTIRGTLWVPASEDEPETWQLEGTNPDMAARGWPGLLAATGASASATVTFDDLSVFLPEFFGEVTKLEPGWDSTGTDAVVQLAAHGTLGRLETGESPARSALTRAYLSGDVSDLVAYWPCEDQRGANTLAGGIDGVTPMQLTGTPQIAGFSDFDCSQPIPVTSTDSRWAGVVPPYTATGEVSLRWLMHIPAGTPNPTSVMSLHVTGTAHTWYVYYNGAPGSLFIKAYAADGTTLYTGGGIGFNLDDRLVLMTLQLTQDGADIDFDLSALDTVTGQAGGAGDTLAGHTVGAAIMPVVNRDFNCGGIAVGHIGIQSNTNNSRELDDPAQAWRGERSGIRAQRLCGQDDVAFSYEGDLETTAPMGAQPVKSLPALLEECVQAEQGTITDSTSAAGVHFRAHATINNQAAALALSYSGTHLSGEFKPKTDRAGLFNDVTVERDGGSPARAVITSGPGSILAPPNGINRYDTSVSRNVYTDLQALQLAWFMASRGSFDGDRYPQLHVQTERAPYIASESLRLAAMGLRVDDLITVDGAASIKRYDQIPLIAAGLEKRFGRYTRAVTANCEPAEPYQVFEVEHDLYGRWHTGGAELAVAIDENDTALSVATTAGPLFTTAAADFPFDVAIGGEAMTCTDIDNELITYGAVGTAAHGDNAAVSPGLPGSLAQFNLIVGFTAIRNTAATANTPTGYTTLADFGHVKLIGKIAAASESAPSCTYSGGSAGDTTSAQLIRLAGAFYDINNLVVAKAGAHNTSAQNVAYPGLTITTRDCIVIYLAWKQDDYTSAASPGTEIAEASTTTGNDQSLTWAYTIQTTAAHIAPGSFTITGGASAVSMGAVVALRCDRQAFTVTRNINSLPGGKQHAVGAPVDLAVHTGWAYRGSAA